MLKTLRIEEKMLRGDEAGISIVKMTRYVATLQTMAVGNQVMSGKER